MVEGSYAVRMHSELSQLLLDRPVRLSDWLGWRGSLVTKRIVLANPGSN